MLLFDENLSFRLPKLMGTIYPECLHVADAGLESSNDYDVWKFALEHELCIVSKDSDFNLIQKQRGYPPKIIWLRLGNKSTFQIANTLISFREEILVFLNDGASGILEIF
jgi:predicted nuclease of predicted toxin-antitoxin system